MSLSFKRIDILGSNKICWGTAFVVETALILGKKQTPPKRIKFKPRVKCSKVCILGRTGKRNFPAASACIAKPELLAYI